MAPRPAVSSPPDSNPESGVELSSDSADKKSPVELVFAVGSLGRIRSGLASHSRRRMTGFAAAHILTENPVAGIMSGYGYTSTQ